MIRTNHIITGAIQCRFEILSPYSPMFRLLVSHLILGHWKHRMTTQTGHLQAKPVGQMFSQHMPTKVFGPLRAQWAPLSSGIRFREHVSWSQSFAVTTAFLRSLSFAVMSGFLRTSLEDDGWIPINIAMDQVSLALENRLLWLKEQPASN